jgi:hypothetical protein
MSIEKGSCGKKDSISIGTHSSCACKATIWNGKNQILNIGRRG